MYLGLVRHNGTGFIEHYYITLGKPQKKTISLTPLKLSGPFFLDFLLEIQKKLFFLSGKALTPPPPLRANKQLLFCGFP